MSEKLKVFKNVANQVATDSISTINVITNTDTEQAVLTNLKVEVSEPNYPLSLVVNMDEIPLTDTENISIENLGTKASIDVSGKQIVDNLSSVDVVVDTTSDGDHFKWLDSPDVFYNMNAVVFQSSYCYIIKNNSTETRTSRIATPFLTTVSTITSTVNTGLSGLTANSAFGWLDHNSINFNSSEVISYDDIKRYSRCSSSRIYTYDKVLNLLQTSVSFAGTVYGACTDGTYFYGKATTNDTTLQRINTKDGKLATSITMSQSFPGQVVGNPSYFLYYNGHIYYKQIPSSTVVYKINVTTGNVASLTVASIGTCMAGGIITVAVNGTPYLVEHTNTGTTVINLSTFTVVPVTWDTNSPITVSTEYGNCALEISDGVVAFIYNAYHVYFDTNTMTRSAAIANSTSNLPSIATSTHAASIANMPLNQTKQAGIIPREITYTLYADGVKITGV